MRARAAVIVGLLLVACWTIVSSAQRAGKKSKAGEQCAGIASIQCEDGLWCDLKGKCNTLDAGGVCVKVPEVCPKDYTPVCGCDGKTYGNDCERRVAKAQKDHDGECAKK